MESKIAANSRPLISVVMPAYNAALFIAQSIQCVLRQSYPSWELLIVDDGSTDETASVVLSFAKNDARITLISQANTGQSSARNAAIGKVSGEWVAFLDADDEWSPNKLERQMEGAVQNPAVDVFFCSANIIYDRSTSPPARYDTIYGEFSGKEMYKNLYVKNYLPNSSVLVKRTTLIDAGPQQPGYCEDWDLWLKMARNGARFSGLPEVLLNYRRHAGNSSTKIFEMRLWEARVLLQNVDEEWLTPSELKRTFVPLMNLLVPGLVVFGRRSEAVELVRNLKNVLSGWSRIYRLLASTGIGVNRVFLFIHRLWQRLKRGI